MKFTYLKYLVNLSLVAALCWCCNNKQENTKQVVTETKDEMNSPKKTTKQEEKYILFFGNSLTAGYGLEEGVAFPELIQKHLDSLDLGYTVVNAGLSGETSAGGLERIDWVLQQPIDLFVLELGANDALRGLDLNQTTENLHGIIEKVVNTYDIPIIIAGMEAPPNMGKVYTDDFRKIFSDLASKYNAGYIPFLLEGVAGIDSLNIADGIHPNIRGHQIVKENVWTVLKPYVTDPSF